MSPVIYSNMLYTSHYMKQEKESFHDSCILSDNCILSKQWPHWHPIQLNSHTTFHPGKLYYFLQLFLYSLNPNLGVVFSVVKFSWAKLSCVLLPSVGVIVFCVDFHFTEFIAWCWLDKQQKSILIEWLASLIFSI